MLPSTCASRWGNSLEIGMLFDVFFTTEYDASATFDPALVQDAVHPC